MYFQVPPANVERMNENITTFPYDAGDAVAGENPHLKNFPQPVQRKKKWVGAGN